MERRQYVFILRGMNIKYVLHFTINKISLIRISRGRKKIHLQRFSKSIKILKFREWAEKFKTEKKQLHFLQSMYCIMGIALLPEGKIRFLEELNRMIYNAVSQENQSSRTERETDTVWQWETQKTTPNQPIFRIT